jgi:hypothetical protein
MFEEARKNAFVSKGDFIHLYYFEHFVQGEKFFQIIRKPMGEHLSYETKTFSCYECEKKLINKTIISKEGGKEKYLNSYKLVPKTDKVVKLYLNIFEPFKIVKETFERTEKK